MRVDLCIDKVGEIKRRANDLGVAKVIYHCYESGRVGIGFLDKCDTRHAIVVDDEISARNLRDYLLCVNTEGPMPMIELPAPEIGTILMPEVVDDGEWSVGDSSEP